jgi:hypothetical protein
MLGHLVSNNATHMGKQRPSHPWFKRLVAVLFGFFKPYS